MKKRKSFIKSWSIKNIQDIFILNGYGTDERFDNEWVRSSRLIKIDFEKKIAETKNTIYKLE
jgi:hypothetical protein